MEKDTSYSITHIGVTGLPDEKRKRLFFYTKTEKEKDFFYLRFSGAGFNKKQLKKIIKNGNIIALKKSISIKKDETLWLDDQGDVYLGESKENGEISFLFSYENVLKSNV